MKMFKKTCYSGKGESNRQKRRALFSFIILASGIFLLLAAGCASSPKYYGGSDSFVTQAPAPEEAGRTYKSPVAYDSALPAGLPLEQGLQTPAESSPQYIIRNASLSVIVVDIEKAAKEIQEKTALLGGYISSLNLYDLTQERRAGYISLRIPEEKFDSALEMLEEIGQVKNKNIYEQDVTLQYIDLEARIATLEAQEERLRELLNRAEKVEEVLEVEKELWRIRGNLESMIAEFKHLQQRVRFSTVDIHLEEKDPLTASLVENLGTGEKLKSLLALNTNRLIKGVSSFIVVTIGSLPILIPLVLALLIVRKIVLATRQRKKAKAQPPSEQKEKTLEG